MRSAWILFYRSASVCAVSTNGIHASLSVRLPARILIVAVRTGIDHERLRMYRTIDCRFWTDDKIRVFSPGARLLILYLITNPHSHYCGLYYLSIVTMQHEVRLLKHFEASWAELQSSDMVRFDDHTEQVWVVKMLAYQARGQKLEKGAANHLRSLNPSPLVPQFLARYPNVGQFCSSDTLSIAYPCPIDTVPSFPSPDPDLLITPNPDLIPDLKSTSHTKKKSSGHALDIPIPDDWSPKEHHQKLASARKLDLPIEAAHFRGKAEELGWVTKDWDKKFNNWMLQEIKFRQRRAP